jgi:hypothetical protein
VPVIWIVVIGLLFLLPLAYLGWRMSQGGDLESGGSMGHQIGNRKEDDWGPHSD